jgi:hypothetical protein
MKIFVLALACVLLVAGHASAQTGAIVSGTIEVCPSAGGACLSNTFTMATTQTTCNLATPPPLVMTFVARAYFDDPVNSTPTVRKYCLTTMGTFLRSLPVIAGSFVATITFTDDLGRTSLKSLPSPPFWRDGMPATQTAPLALHVIQ